MEKYDEVNHPKHYVENRFWIEPHEVFRNLSYPHGNALKYILRAGKKLYPGKTEKESYITDLRKAQWYLEDRSECYVTDQPLLRAMCESGINEIISRAYYPGINLDDEGPHDVSDDKPKSFWQNLQTIVEYEVEHTK